MIRVALPKGRNLGPALEALAAAGVPAADFADDSRSLRRRVAAGRLGAIEFLSLKDRDLPLYVERGVADCGFVGSDVLEEVDGDLLVLARLAAGGCRLSLIGPAAARPSAGSQVRLATKYPRTARRWLEGQPWGAEIVELSGSVELAPLLGLADLALDVVQTGRTLAENGLVELEVVAEIAPCFAVQRAAWQRLRGELNAWVERLEAAGAVL